MIKFRSQKRLLVKTQVFATLIAVVSAVLLPQVFHAVGALTGAGSALGEIYLPMHLSIIIVGLFAGVYAGAIAGVVSPLISFALTGMPSVVMLPFMCIELFAYGFVAGVLRDAKLPTVVKVLIVQVLGRVARALAILIAIGVNATALPVAVIYTSVLTGLPGIAIQLVLIPLVIRLCAKLR